MRRHPLSQACNVATFEVALDEICSRQNRCFHALQLLLALLFVTFVFAACLVSITLGCVFILEDAEVRGLWLCSVSGFGLLIVRLLQRVLSVERSAATARRVNESLKGAGLDVAFDSYSRCLFSCQEELVRTCSGDSARRSTAQYRSTTDH